MIKNLKLKIKNFKQGFTLIELMVSISIIAIVSSAVMVGRNGAEQEMFLRITAFSLSQNLREYQEKALSGENVVCPNPLYHVCGFGINFVKDNYSYTPFVDCLDNCSNSNHALDSNDKILPTISLGKAKIYSLPPNVLIPNTFNVVFSPPDPAVYLNNIAWGDEAATGAVITLCLKANNNIKKTVKLNNAGKIEIQ